MRHRITPLYFLRKNWLLVGILGCIFVAGMYPKLGSKEGKILKNKTMEFFKIRYESYVKF